jgi:hypothetical protein
MLYNEPMTPRGGHNDKMTEENKMGQYHMLVNLDKREFVSPHALGLGLKQREHNGAFDGTLADALYFLTMTSPARGGGDYPETEISSRWAGDRCVVLGDYTVDEDIPNYIGAGSLWTQIGENAHGEWRDISEDVATEFRSIFAHVGWE